MKYLNNAPFSSQPATDAYRKNYPFRDKFAEALAAEKKNTQTSPCSDFCEDCGDCLECYAGAICSVTGERH